MKVRVLFGLINPYHFFQRSLQNLNFQIVAIEDTNKSIHPLKNENGIVLKAEFLQTKKTIFIQ